MVTPQDAAVGMWGSESNAGTKSTVLRWALETQICSRNHTDWSQDSSVFLVHSGYMLLCVWEQGPPFSASISSRGKWVGLPTWPLRLFLSVVSVKSWNMQPGSIVQALNFCNCLSLLSGFLFLGRPEAINQVQVSVQLNLHGFWGSRWYVLSTD